MNRIDQLYKENEHFRKQNEMLFKENKTLKNQIKSANNEIGIITSERDEAIFLLKKEIKERKPKQKTDIEISLKKENNSQKTEINNLKRTIAKMVLKLNKSNI